MTVYSETIPTARGHYVYRFWAADGTCVYVGCVGERGPRRLSARFAQHKRQSPWWPQVARIDVAGLASTADVITEERAQIAQLNPVHNRQHLGRCQKGHDTAAPGARDEDGRCARCQHDQRAKHGPEYKSRPEVKIRNAETARIRYRRRLVSPGQGRLW